MGRKKTTKEGLNACTAVRFQYFLFVFSFVFLSIVLLLISTYIPCSESHVFGILTRGRASNTHIYVSFNRLFFLPLSVVLHTPVLSERLLFLFSFILKLLFCITLHYSITFFLVSIQSPSGL